MSPEGAGGASSAARGPWTQRWGRLRLAPRDGDRELALTGKRAVAPAAAQGAARAWAGVRPRTRRRGAARRQGGAERQAGAMLTLRVFSMLTSQPSKRRNWAIRTSWSATAWYERSSAARKASHSCSPPFHSVMNVPAGQEMSEVRPCPATGWFLHQRHCCGLQTRQVFKFSAVNQTPWGPAVGVKQASKGSGCWWTLEKHGCTQGLASGGLRATSSHRLFL